MFNLNPDYITNYIKHGYIALAFMVFSVASNLFPKHLYLLAIISIISICICVLLIDLPEIKKSRRLMMPGLIAETSECGSLIEILLILSLWVFYNHSFGILFPLTFLLISLIRFIMQKFIIDEIKESRRKLLSPDYIYLGTKICEGGESINNKKAKFDEPLFVKDDATRTMHTGLFGATGVGKTSSVIIPLVRHDIITGKHTVVIDPKNDGELANRIYQACKEVGKRMIYVNFSRPELSDAYNPLAYGSPNMVKDKLMASAPWSEQFYKTVAMLHTLSSANKITWDKIKGRKEPDVRTDASLNSMELNENDGVTLEKILPYLEEQPKTEGIVAFIESLKQSEAGYILREDPASGAKKFWESEDVGAVLFVIPTEKMSELSNYLGKLIYSDYKALSGYIKDLPKEKQKSMSFYIDEASKFIDEDFINYLTMARSSNTRIFLATQGISDFAEFGESMMSRVMGNIQTKIIMQTTSGKDAEFISKAVGTHEVEIFTEQVEENFTVKKTGKGTMRVGKEFRIHTDQLKNLGVGEGIIIQNGNSDIQHLYFDSRYFLPPINVDIQNERFNDPYFINRAGLIEKYIKNQMREKFDHKYSDSFEKPPRKKRETKIDTTNKGEVYAQ